MNNVFSELKSTTVPFLELIPTPSLLKSSLSFLKLSADVTILFLCNLVNLV